MNVLLHERTQAQLEAIRQNPHRSFIFHGARSVGKATAARELARSLNCQGDDTGACGPCRQFKSGNYPDLVTIGLEDRSSILIEQIRSLVQTLSLRPYYNQGTRVVIIDDAHLMTVDAQNALLKLIEEPPDSTTFILVAQQVESLLPTVRSRCQAVHFAKPTRAAVAALLERQHNLKPVQASELALAAENVPGAAVLLATDPVEAEARIELVRLAAAVPGMSLFNRLVAAGQLATSKADLWRFSAVLHAQFVEHLRSTAGPAAPATGVEAIEKFRRQLQAKVSPRVALERLMMEL